MIYELINPSDEITFEAEDDLIAKICALVVGHGRYGLHRITEDGEPMEIMLPFLSWPTLEQVIEIIGKDINELLMENNEKVIACFKSFAVCPVKERETYRTYTNNYTKNVSAWDNDKRTSTANICAFAHSIKYVPGE